MDEDKSKGKKKPGTQGEVLHVTIEISDMPRGDRRIITGCLQDLAQESGRVAMSWFIRHRRALCAWLDEEPLNLKKAGIHLHVEGFSQPLDGSSACAAFVVAIVGYATVRKIKQWMAITGNVNLRGEILPVSGIPEKLEAARRRGLSKVLIPAVNMEQSIRTEIYSNVKGVD